MLRAFNDFDKVNCRMMMLMIIAKFIKIFVLFPIVNHYLGNFSQ
jgi:hypothetical protein